MGALTENRILTTPQHNERYNDNINKHPSSGSPSRGPGASEETGFLDAVFNKQIAATESPATPAEDSDKPPATDDKEPAEEKKAPPAAEKKPAGPA